MHTHTICIVYSTISMMKKKIEQSKISCESAFWAKI